MDQATLLPLPVPQREPLSLSRHVKVVEGSFDKAVVDEAVEMKVGSTTTTEEYQYVMDRRTMTLVDDPRQYAFGDPMATMHGSGGYRINFAMGTEASGSYLAYIPEADVTTPLVLVEGPHHHAEGATTVIDFATKLEAPVAPYYLAHLQTLGLPMQITAAQIAPLLTAAGIDVNQALADVAPQLTADESAVLAAALTAAIPELLLRGGRHRVDRTHDRRCSFSTSTPSRRASRCSPTSAASGRSSPSWTSTPRSRR